MKGKKFCQRTEFEVFLNGGKHFKGLKRDLKISFLRSRKYSKGLRRDLEISFLRSRKQK